MFVASDALETGLEVMGFVAGARSHDTRSHDSPLGLPESDRRQIYNQELQDRLIVER